jgi:hypothetical protein
MQHSTVAALARQLAQNKLDEFSYTRSEKIEYSSAGAISSYISFARDIRLLDGDLQIARQKKEVRALDNFQGWLADLTLQYLDRNNASLLQLGDLVHELCQRQPHVLPTQEKLRSLISEPPSARSFRFSLKILSLLRSNTIVVASRRVVLLNGIMEG